MKKQRRSRMIKIGSLLSILFAWTALAQEVSVSATVDRNQMGTGDTFTLSIAIASSESLNVSDPQLPDLSKFDLINTWKGVESQSAFINGNFQVRRTQRFNYMLAPRTQGQLTIDSIPVTVDGKTYNTKPIVIAVNDNDSQTGNIAQNQQQQQNQESDEVDPLAEADEMFQQLLQRRLNPNGFRGQPRGVQPGNPGPLADSFFIQSEVNKKSVFAGEQVTVGFYLYTRGQIRDIDTLKYPSLKGFWKEDIEVATRLNFTNEVINGIVYNKALLASYALFPIKAGKSVIDSYQAKCTVLAPSAFGFGQPAQFTKASKPIEIDVKPVPPGAPQNFGGAVGKFQLAGTMDQNAVQANQPVTLRLRFEGTGNAKLIELPSLTLPKGVELYDTKKESKFYANGTSYKQFEVLVIPREPGQFVVPSVSVTLFNPETEKFYELKSQDFQLLVNPAGSNEMMQGKPMTQAASDQPSAPAAAQLPAPVLNYKPSVGFWTASQAAMAWSFAFVVAFGLIAFRYAKDAELGRRDKQSAHEILDLKFAKIHKLANGEDLRSVGTEMVNAVYFVLQETMSGEVQVSSLDQLFEQIPPSVKNQWEKQIRENLTLFETLGFAPEHLLGDLKKGDKIKKAVAQMEKILQGVAKTGWADESDKGSQT